MKRIFVEKRIMRRNCGSFRRYQTAYLYYAKYLGIILLLEKSNANFVKPLIVCRDMDGANYYSRMLTS